MHGSDILTLTKNFRKKGVINVLIVLNVLNVAGARFDTFPSSSHRYRSFPITQDAIGRGFD